MTYAEASKAVLAHLSGKALTLWQESVRDGYLKEIVDGTCTAEETAQYIQDIADGILEADRLIRR